MHVTLGDRITGPSFFFFKDVLKIFIYSFVCFLAAAVLAAARGIFTAVHTLWLWRGGLNSCAAPA